MKDKINDLYSKDNKLAYNTLLELELITIDSNDLYDYFDELLVMLKNDKSFVRVRGFRLICALAKWDTKNKINNNIESILNELNDDNGTAIREYLDKIKMIVTYKVELSDIIETKLRNINISKYKESIQDLIKDDIIKVVSMIELNRGDINGTI